MGSDRKILKMKKELISSRILTLGTIDEDNSNDIIYAILEINYSDKLKKPEQREPIKLIINSIGGDMYSGFGIIDCISNSTTPIHTICYGSAFSMALPILIIGHYRMMSNRSTLMYHEGGFDLGHMKLTGHTHEINELNRIEKICDDLMLEKTKLTLKQFKTIKKQQKEWYITPTEALKYGIVDEII
jgi:ATP-dependent Clp protease protease subunit